MAETNQREDARTTRARTVLAAMGLKVAADTMSEEDLVPLLNVLTEVETAKRNIIVAASLGEVALLAAALSQAQGEFLVPKKTKTATVKGTTQQGQKYEYTYNYSTLDDLIEATRDALAKHKIAVIQDPRVEGEYLKVTTFLLHESGQVWRSSPLPIHLDGKKAQDVGKAMTYGRRYSLGAALNVAPEEDTDNNQETGEEGSGQRRRVEGPEEREAPGRNRSSAARAPRPAPAAAAAGPTPGEAYKGEAPAAGQAAAGKAGEKKMLGSGDGAHLEGCINKGQIKRLISIQRTHNVTNDQLRDFLSNGGINSTAEIPVDRYDGIIMAIQNGHVSGGTDDGGQEGDS